MDAPAPRDFNLGEGGLLHRLESACHVTRLLSQIVLTFLVTWVPVMALAAAQKLVGRGEPLVHDPAVHVRFFIAAPLLLVADRVFPLICRRALRQLVEQGFVPDERRPRFENLYDKARGLADAAWPELAIAAGALAVGVATLLGVVPLSARYRLGPTAAQLWYVLVAAPLLRFLLWRSLWRWVVWVRIVWGLSRIRLRLVATHADRCGGIGFLRLPSVGYCAMLLFVASSLLCAEWGGAHYAPSTTLMALKPIILLFVIVGAAVAFAPLFFFTPQLVRARFDGMLECDALAAKNGWDFRRAWIVEHGRDFLQAQDAQTLAALAHVYRDSVERIRYFIFDKRDVIVLLLATLVPVVPVLLLHVPSEDWRDLVQLLSGSRLP